MKVRSIYRAALVENAIAPYNSILLKVFYPATLELTAEALNFGIVPVNKTNAPFPVVIFFSGVNIDAGSYHDLAVEMTEKGLVFITFDWVTNALPGNNTGLTPGVDLKNMTPENIAKFPTGSAVQSILNELENINKDSLLKGLLDLDKIIFGGHSAGGRVALESANHGLRTKREVTRDLLPIADVGELRLKLRAEVLRLPASRAEPTSRRRIGRVRRVAEKHDLLTVALDQRVGNRCG